MEEKICESCKRPFLRNSAILSKWMAEHRVFPRFFVMLFCYLCFDMNFWLQEMIETKVLEGGYFVEVYVGAMVGGFVAIVTAYAKTGNSNGDHE